MTTDRSPMKKVWLERAQAGFLRKDAVCVRTRGPHHLLENKSEVGVATACAKCGAGLAIKRTKEEIRKDEVTKDTDLRIACWMCGAPFSSPRTKDEYLHQLCAVCLVAVEDVGLLKLEDPRTREVGGRPPMRAHLSL